MAQPIVSIKVYEIEDFVKEVLDRDVKRIYRRAESAGNRDYFRKNIYTAYDPDHKVFVKGSIRFPEVVALDRFDIGQRYSNWNFECDATCNPSSKRRFTNILKNMGVAQDIVKQFTSVKLEELHKLVDESEIEEGGADSFTYYRKGGEVVRALDCDFMGIISKIKVAIKKEHDVSYKIAIEGWDEIYKGLCAVHESPLSAAGLEVVDGEIEVR